MECCCCKADLPVKTTAIVAIKGKGSCSKCGKSLKLKNRFFIVSLMVILLLFVGVSTYFMVASRIKMGLGLGWNILSLLIPWVILVVVFAMLVIPAMEIEEVS